MTNLFKEFRARLSDREARAAVRAQEEWSLITKLNTFIGHNKPLLHRGSPLAELVYSPEQLSGEFTALQLGFHELGEGAVDEVIEHLVMSGFIYDPDGVYRDLRRERRNRSYALNLNGVFELKIDVLNDSLGKATYITIAPYGEELPDQLD